MLKNMKIKNLVQDLNLVSQLNYNVQPVKQTPVHLCKMIREIVVEYLNNNLNNFHLKAMHASLYGYQYL